VKLVPSSTQVPYYIVTSINSGTAIGLIYLTTDVALKSCWGYNGYIETLVLVNTTGYIKALKIYSMPDSFGYHVTQAWLNTYINRSVFEELQIGLDVQPVTGATYSSLGVNNGVRDAGRIVVDDYQHQQSAGVSNSVSGTGLILGAMILNIFGTIESSENVSTISLIALVCLFVAAVIAFELKSEKARYGVYVVSIIFIGFFAARMVTMDDFTDFVHWIFPPFWSNMYWYVLYGGVLATSLFWGRFYCGFLCPFGAFTDLMNKISPLKLKIPIKYQSKLRLTKYVVLAVVVFEILQNTILYQVEPFGTLFLFNGDTLAWVFLGLILGVSIFFNRFYCKYICPAGAGMALISRFRMKEIKRWPECKKCMICANQCEPQAIKGDHISAFECMDCRGCEKLYLNVKLCPHYAQERILAKKQN
jgi:Pyruvate/2-oxoacid:ferredoxin oxidoreductase delta subunit